MIEFLSKAFITLLVVIDPIAIVPLFVALTRNDTLESRHRTAVRSCLIALILLLCFAIAGDKLLDLMGISEPAFRIAGGILFLLVAIEMVVAKTSAGIRSTTGDEDAETMQREDVSVFPLAIPMIAGPGALTSVVVLMRQAETIAPIALVYTVLVILLVILIVFISLKLGDKLMSLLGVTGTNVLTRVFGIILAALAVQNIITGIEGVVRNFQL